MPAHILLAICENEREIIHSILQRKKYQVATAASIHDALAALESEAYQLALIDEDFISTGDGWALAKAIRQRFGHSLVILMLARGSYSQYADPTTGEFLHKVDWIMHYPVSEEEILGNVERYLRTD